MLLIHVDRGSQNLSLSPEQSSPPGKKVTYVVTTASGDLQSFPRFLLATRHLPFMQLVPVTHATVELQACPAEKHFMSMAQSGSFSGVTFCLAGLHSARTLVVPHAVVGRRGAILAGWQGIQGSFRISSQDRL